MRKSVLIITVLLLTTLSTLSFANNPIYKPNNDMLNPLWEPADDVRPTPVDRTPSKSRNPLYTPLTS